MIAPLCLPVLGGTVAMLILLAAIGQYLPPRAAPAAKLGLCLLAAVAALGALATAAHATLPLPFGFGLLSGSLALDPLGAVFVLVLAVPAAGASLAGLRKPGPNPGPLVALLVLVLAGGPGVFLLGLAVFASLERPGILVAACVILIAAGLALMGGLHTDFAGLRSAPASGARALVAALLLALGALPIMLAGRGAYGVVAGIYVLLRLVFDGAGPPTPLWWGTPLLLAGSGLAVLTGLQALHAGGLPGAAANLARQQAGWMLVALGTALIARGADLPVLASVAIAALLLTLAVTVWVDTLFALVTDAVVQGAGGTGLDVLGGLSRSMPKTALVALAAACSLGLVPFSAGFAACWTVFQALFAGARIGGWPLALCFTVAVAGLAGSAAVTTAALVRLGGAAFLGRPRTPRAAAAEDPALLPMAAMTVLAAILVIAGLLPRAVLGLISPALTSAVSPGLSSIAVQQDAPGYSPAALAALAAGLAAAAWFFTRRAPRPELTAAWEDGFAAPPPWLPFGDPATQASPAALGLGLPAIRLPVLPAWRIRSLPSPQPQWAVLVLAVLALIAGLV